MDPVQRFSAARVARLATAGPDGVPHLVPLVFALAEDTIYSCVDFKPKRTTALRRLKNIAANPSVSILVDHYDDDWDQLWWVRVDGVAEVLDATTAEGTAAIDALAAKYPQYAARRPQGPVITVRSLRWHHWSAVSTS
ncbi:MULTISPECIES: TIGR03668 family PPOX class F420-dependent oxidoreductase [Rhodococcus]|uniref:TIGR03668 family PPOX class F420-dependent oxidoreductase n=1 Tax=Rhodococcus oxybenzonivorans TaxID=1990687 RepID=A0AAE4V547_9NOCA|nr:MULTISPECIES: TIGR03668 family PPOX class F420-dependent oxidoreductase [Rhodococcus]MDV7246003.1 TIGR03668 family PPOX class F420-dependent oxidoreductase [Rhodococcus oxybenzonivorans]MDV7268038.1 TIGR03668 family PPOX class F420-dependent oxidoreductase [Rhodococcus oxybenzonivorans]MDV7277598.1 TIGR03668 family PPOX class F420-dependent oxidoreductase [Rhodococcus oxybenzonivorans]MDV7337016.1 TIGR03668 family PPOX class F420-dependent oxidoreductase [Rhodococcus oxybenzonivorans]MDV734